MQQQNIIVTGANGLVGSQVIQQLAGLGYKIHAVVHHIPSKGYSVFCPDTVFYARELQQETEQTLLDWFANIHPIALIHCAAMTNVDECERQPDLAYTLNTDATRLLARACARYGSHCLMISTDYVFDGQQAQTELYHENDQVHPISHYGHSKALAEMAVQEECFNWTLWTICRTSVVYGSTAWTRADFTQWLHRKLSQQEPVKIVNDQISSPTYSVDLAQMIIQLLQQQAGGVYHTAGNTAIDRYHFAQLFARYLDLDETLIQPIPTHELAQAARRPLNTGLSVDKISRQLGKRPLSLAEGLAQCWSKDRAEDKTWTNYVAQTRAV